MCGNAFLSIENPKNFQGPLKGPGPQPQITQVAISATLGL